MSYWWRLRAWWHANLYQPAAIVPGKDGRFIVECSCGGRGEVRSNGDGTSTVIEATCPLWVWLYRVRPLLLPVVRVIQ